MNVVRTPSLRRCPSYVTSCAALVRRSRSPGDLRAQVATVSPQNSIGSTADPRRACRSCSPSLARVLLVRQTMSSLMVPVSSAPFTWSRGPWRAWNREGEVRPLARRARSLNTLVSTARLVSEMERRQGDAPIRILADEDGSVCASAAPPSADRARTSTHTSRAVTSWRSGYFGGCCRSPEDMSVSRASSCAGGRLERSTVPARSGASGREGTRGEVACASSNFGPRSTPHPRPAARLTAERAAAGDFLRQVSHFDLRGSGGSPRTFAFRALMHGKGL